MTAERKIIDAEKKIKAMDLEVLIDLTHEMANEFYGIDTAISLTKDKNGWVIADDYNNWFADGVNIRDCYEMLYIHILEEVLKEELENEAYLNEMETRASFDRWFNDNNGVPYGKY